MRLPSSIDCQNLYSERKPTYIGRGVGFAEGDGVGALLFDGRAGEIVRFA